MVRRVLWALLLVLAFAAAVGLLGGLTELLYGLN